jgi:hypothetical protein
MVIDIRWTKIIEKRMAQLAEKSLADKQHQHIRKILLLLIAKRYLNLKDNLLLYISDRAGVIQAKGVLQDYRALSNRGRYFYTSPNSA